MGRLLHPIAEKHLSKAERNAEICQRYPQGEALETIAENFSLSRQRFHELVCLWCS
jgi:hypothetical protein